MATIDKLARDFLAQPCIAVAGVSADRDTPANLILRTLRNRGTTVYPINPKHDAYLGERCYPDVASLPRKPDGVVIVTRPAIAEELVRQCIDAGVPRVWLHSMLGTTPHFGRERAARITSVSPTAVDLCRRNGITVIPGSCPMQFAGDFGHTCMRGFLRITGALEVPA